MQRLIPMIDNSGVRYSIPEDRVDEFRADMGENASEGRRYRGKDGTHYTIPQDQDEAFRADMPDAVPVRTMQMSDGTKRDFTDAEMSRYLRSREYRESEDYIKPEQKSVAYEGFKGALSGALSGAYAGGKSALGKVVSAVPELVAGATEAVGNAVNLGGNAPNAVGNWFRDSGRSVKKWLDDNVKSSVADNLGYEDWSTKMSEIAGDAAGMAVKFAPAAAMGPAFMESVFATDGINAYTSSFEAAKANGASDFDANLAGAASGLIAYYGGKLLMKGNAATSGIKSVLGKALGGIGWDAAVMGAQQAGETGVQNVIEGKPITQDMLGAGIEGAATGAQFRIFNEGSRVRDVVRETKQMREMRRENLLTAAENTNGGAFLDSLMGGEEMNSAVRARRNGEDVSRKMGKALDLPDNMSVKERNAVVDAVIRARDAQAERVRTRMDDVQAQSLADAIGGTVGDMNDPNFEKVWIKAVGQIKDATELDDPAKRAEIVWNAVKEVFGAEADGNDGVKREAVFDERSLREKNIRNRNNRIERRIAEQNLGERKIIKEMQEEADTLPPDQPVLSGGEDLMRQQANIYATEDVAGAKSYSTWLKKRGQKDTESNRVKWFESYASRKPDAKSVEGTKVRAERKAEMEDYERADAERKAREAREESTLQPQETRIEVGKTAERIAEPEEAGKAQWPEYKAWLKNKGRDDTVKSWNRFVMENELDPNLRVDTKDQQSYSAFRERMEGLAEPQKPRRFPKDQEAAAQAEEQRGAEMRMNRNSDFRKLKDAGLSDEDAGYYLTYGKEAFYKRRVEQWEASRVKAQKQGQKFEEPKPERESLDYDALLAEQKSRMEAADKAAADAAHEERGKGLAEAFADWREESVKAQKQGKKSPEPTAEVEDVRAKAEADSVVQRLNAEWQKAKTPAERNAIKVQLIDRLKQLGIGAIERGTSAAEKPAEPAKPQHADNAPSHAPQETKPTSRPEGAEGKEERNSASVVTVGSMTERMTAKGRIVDSVVKVNDDGSVIIREQTFRKGNDKPYRETDRTYSADEAAQIIGNKTPTTTKTIRVPDGKGKMVEKPKGGNDYDSLVESYKSNEERLTEAVNSGNEVARLEALIEQAKTELKLRKAEVGMTKTFDRTANMSLTNNALKNRISDLMEALASERGRMVEKPAPSPEAATKSLTPTAKPAPKASAPVVEKAKGGEVAVEAPDSVEAKIAAMPYGQERRKAQFDYMDAEVKKAKEAIKGKFTQGKDKKWTTEDKSVSPTITVKVPADGEFTVVNNPDGIALLEKMSSKLKAQVKDREKELPTGSKKAFVPGVTYGGAPIESEVRETVWTKDKPSATPKSPSLAVKKPVKNITVKDAAEIVKPFVDTVRKSLTKPHVGDGVVVATDGRRLVIVDVPGAKESGGEYPNWKQVIPKKTAHEAKFSTEELYTKLEQAKVVADGETNAVGIYELADGSLGVLVKSETAEYSTHEKMPKNARLVGMFNVDFLLDATKTAAKMGDKEMRIGYNDSYSPVIHRGNGYKQVIMPLRIQERAEDISMRANDAKRRSRPEVLAWAKKNMRQIIGSKVTVEGMREYDAQMAKKAKVAVKRLFPDMEIEYYEKDPNLGGKAITLRNRSGGVLGYFSPSDKRVALLPGADAETVAHEVGWHGVRDWAKRNAPDLFKKMREVEDNVDPALRTKVLRIYRTATGYDRDTLLNEFGAWTFMGRGGKALEEVVSTREGAAWYAKMLNAAKDIYKDFATKHGGNRIDLSRINEMNGEEFMDYMAKEIASGKSLGNIKEPTQGDGNGKAISTKEGRFEKLKRKTYDVGTVFRVLEKDIEKKTGAKVASDDSVDQAFALKAGLNEATNINLKTKIRNLKKLYADNGISHDDFVGYMAAKAAAGRDAKIDAKNIKALQEQMHDQLRADWGRARVEADPEGFKAACDNMDAIIENNYRTSNGSHIDPKEAARTVREWESGDMAEKTAKLRKAWREIIDETIDAQVEAGLVSRETAERWKAEEPDYVPFKSPIDEATGEYVGRADRNFSRAEHFEAKGRQTAAGDVLTHALMDWQTTMNRAADNNVRAKLAKLVEKHPELGTVEKLGNSDVHEKKTADKFAKDGRLILDDGGDPNVIIFKRNGESYVIRLNGTRGTAAAAAITGRNLKHVNATIKAATRLSAGMATEYSPTFAARNWQKDQLALGEIVVAERGAVEGGKWLGHYASAQKDTHMALWKFVTTGKVDANTKGGRILQDFIDAGGMIGGYEKESFGDVAKELSLNEITKELKQGKSLGVAVAKHTLKSVAYLNKMSELISRVNAFEAERRMGKDKDGRAVTNESAALFARRALVDFNRAGENTGWTNTWKMFSNSAIGANARAVEAACSNKHGAALLTTMAVWGAAQAVINHAINADADVEREKQGLGTGKDVGEWEIRSSFANFRIGDKTYKLGQHEDVFTFASYVGNTLARCVMGEISPKDAAKNLGITAAELGAVFTGFGDANLDSKDGDAVGMMKAIAVYLTPSLVQPVAELAMNQDYAGRKVFTDTYPGNHTPRSRQGRKGTPEYAKTAAEWINDNTGGNEHRKGIVDVPPEAIRKLVEGFGKNALKDVMNIYETGKAIQNGEYDKLAPDLKPVKRDFVRQVPDSTNRFFDRKTSVEADIDDWKGNRASMTPDERNAYLEAHPWVKQSVQDRLNRLVNGSRKDGVRGINDLRKLIDGKVLRGDRWVEREEPPSDERIEAWTTELRKKQAKYLELTQKK